MKNLKKFCFHVSNDDWNTTKKLCYEKIIHLLISKKPIRCISNNDIVIGI
jgi:hypothetical protein